MFWLLDNAILNRNSLLSLMFFLWVKSHWLSAYVVVTHLLLCCECKCLLFFNWVRIHSHNQWRGSPLTTRSGQMCTTPARASWGLHVRKAGSVFHVRLIPTNLALSCPPPLFSLVKSIAIMGFRLQLVTLWVEESKPGRCTCADEWRGKRMYVLVLRVGAVKLALMISILWHN